MKHGYGSFFWMMVLMVGLAPIGWAQTSPVRFVQLPASLQLYPRTAANTADVPVSGMVLAAGFSRVSLSVFRNNQPFFYRSQSPAGIGAFFSWKVPIRAELAEYRFEVFGVKSSTDSLRLARRDSVVCGDVYLVMGQSNATTTADAISKYTYRNEYCRSFGNLTDPILPSDTLWALSEEHGALVGVWAHELQRLIIEAYKIPVCVLNGGVAGTSIGYHYRDNAQPTVLSSIYGRLLYRVLKSGLLGAARALFWRQGEAEGYFNTPGYAQLFDPIFRAWKLDYPTLQRTYLFQNNIIDGTSTTAGEVLEFQRRSPEIYPDIINLATVGTTGYDGTHYNAAGYVQTAHDIFRLVARDFYGSTDTSQITSPNLRKAFYTSPEHTEIKLVFDPGQVLTWPADSSLRTAAGQSYTRRLADFVYLDGSTGTVQQGRAEGNAILLKLSRTSTAARISYLPAAYSDAFSRAYDGPHIRNGRGLAAFAFQNVTLQAPLPAPSLVVETVGADNIQLGWSIPAGPTITALVLERSDNDGRSFSTLATLPPTARDYADTQNLLRGTRYVYRLYSVGIVSESPPETVAAITSGLQIVYFAAKPVAYNAIRLDWTSTTGAAGFTQSVLERSTRSDGGFAEIARIAYPTLTYLDSLLPTSTTFYYRIRTRNGSTEAPPALATAQTPAITGIADEPGPFAVFPNPARHALTLRLPQRETVTVRLFDLSGKQVLEKTDTATLLLLDCAPLPPGLYLLRVETPDGIQTRKVALD